ncbi:MAG: hypothetical protein ABSG76_21850 [Xanthobacteraceae bacterium]
MHMSARGAMPHFFFHFRKGARSLMDREGETFDDVVGARRMALAIARDFVDRARGAVSRRWAGWSIDVRDQRGNRILLMPLEQVTRVTPLDQDDTALPRVVRLDSRRPHRLLSALTNQTRHLRRQSAMVSDRQRYVVKRLGYEIRMAQEVARQSHELLARSRLSGPLLLAQADSFAR